MPADEMLILEVEGDIVVLLLPKATVFPGGGDYYAVHVVVEVVREHLSVHIHTRTCKLPTLILSKYEIERRLIANKLTESKRYISQSGATTALDRYGQYLLSVCKHTTRSPDETDTPVAPDEIVVQQEV